MKTGITILALLFGTVAVVWHWIQMGAYQKLEVHWESRDTQRRESIAVLGDLYVATKPTKKQIIDSLKRKSVDFYEKDGKIEIGDLSVSVQDGLASDIEAFEYLDK